MKFHLLKRGITLATLLLSVLVITATASPLSSATNDTLTTEQSTNNPYEAMQMAGLNTWAMGNTSVGLNYDTLLGVIVNTHYAREINANWAAGIIGELGENQYRLNGTLGRNLWKDAQVKFTTDYLSQKLGLMT
jgi:hypothetical protein